MIRSLAQELPEVWRFIEELEAAVTVGTVANPDELIARCRAFYTPGQVSKIDATIPGWATMASYANQKTLWHVNVAMVALKRLPEYAEVGDSGRVVAEWVTLLHDIGKEPESGRDHCHAFRSAAAASTLLPRFGFPVSSAYQAEVLNWQDLVCSATRSDLETGVQTQDNSKLALIAGGARRLFPEPTRAAVMAIALHQSITVLARWPVRAPLTPEQANVAVDGDLRPLLRTLMLADSGGWNLFDPPTLDAMYDETRTVFAGLESP